MEVIQCNNLKEHREKIIELKNMDCEFNYNMENEKLFFLISNEKVYGYAILDLQEENARAMHTPIPNTANFFIFSIVFISKIVYSYSLSQNFRKIDFVPSYSKRNEE